MRSSKQLPILSAAAAIVLVVIWYLAMWSPESKSVQKAHAANAVATQKIGQLQSQAGGLQALVKKIPADNARFAQLEAEMPDNPQFDQALNQLQQAAAQTGVSVPSVTPSTPPEAGGSAGSAAQSQGIPAISLTMSVQGTSQQLEAFLSALYSMQRTVVVDRVSMSGGTSTSMSISARIFYAGKPTP